MHYYFYAIKSKKDGKNYYGVTDNITRRLEDHNAGKNKSTRNRRPFTLLLIKCFLDRKSAYHYEWQVKHNGVVNKVLKDEIAEVAKVVKAPV